MEATKLREKLKNQFSEIIADDKNLNYLERIFDEFHESYSTSQVPESHYQRVEERRRRHMDGESESRTWKEVKEKIIKKHGF